MHFRSLVVLLAVSACSPTGVPSPKVAQQPSLSAPVRSGIVWVENNAKEALAQAKARNLPLFVDIAASWCHTCKHMESSVLTEAPVQHLADEAIWLHIDVDRPENEAFLQTHAYAALPTYLLLDPTGTEKSRWVGSMEASEVAAFVTLGAGGSELLRQVTMAALAKNWDGVLRLTTPALSQTDRSLWERLSLATLAMEARLEKKMPDGERNPGAVLLANLVHDALDAPAADLREHADDVSSAFEMLSEDGLQKGFVLKHWSAFLEGQARAAPTKQARAAFDAHRVLAYIFAHTHAKAIPMLEQSASEFPNDFNPPARLARIHRMMGNYDEAKVQAARARSLVTGPRTLRVIEEQIAVAEATGDLRSARVLLRDIVDYPGWLPSSGEQAKDRAKQRLDALASIPESAPQPGDSLQGFSGCKHVQGAILCGETRCSPGKIAGTDFLICSIPGDDGSSNMPSEGCMVPSKRAVRLSDAKGGALLTSRESVGKALNPTSTTDVAAFVRLVFDVDDKSTPVVSGSNPYTVSFEQTQNCGCTHPVYRVNVRINKDGSSRELSRAVVRQTMPGLCVD